MALHNIVYNLTITVITLKDTTLILLHLNSLKSNKTTINTCNKNMIETK